MGGTGLAYAASGGSGRGRSSGTRIRIMRSAQLPFSVKRDAELGHAAGRDRGQPWELNGARLIRRTPRMPSTSTSSHCRKDTSGRWGSKSRRTGSAARSCRALRLDSNGNVLATDDSGMGLPSDPNDPYLFMGSTGHVLCGGFRDRNLPNLSGGYNPVLGIPGTTGVSQQGGPLLLRWAWWPRRMISQRACSPLHSTTVI